jgi:hypothetical protein
MKIFRKDGLQKAPPFVEALEKEKKNDDAASFGGHPSDFLYQAYLHTRVSRNPTRLGMLLGYSHRVSEICCRF